MVPLEALQRRGFDHEDLLEVFGWKWLGVGWFIGGLCWFLCVSCLNTLIINYKVLAKSHFAMELSYSFTMFYFILVWKWREVTPALSGCKEHPVAKHGVYKRWSKSTTKKGQLEDYQCFGRQPTALLVLLAWKATGKMRFQGCRAQRSATNNEIAWDRWEQKQPSECKKKNQAFKTAFSASRHLRKASCQTKHPPT